MRDRSRPACAAPANPSAEAVRGRFDINLLLVLLPLGLSLLFAGQDWPFDEIGDLDAFKYVGIFLQYPLHLPAVDADYKTSRLPWILPGFLAYRLLPPVAAHYTLQLTFLAALNIAMYLSLKRLFGDGIALVATLLYATHYWYQGPRMWGTGGFSYHNTAELLYYFATVLCLVTALEAPSNRNWWLVAAGASAACAMHTSLFVAPFFLFLLPLLLWYREGANPTARSVVGDSAWIIAGGVGLTGVLSVVSALGGGPILFFMPQVRYTAQTGRDNVWFLPIGEYAARAFWLAYPILAAVAAALLIIARRPVGRLVLAAQLQFLLSASYLVLLSTALRQGVLQFSPITMALAGPLILAFAAFLLATASENRRSLSAMGTLAALAIMLGPLIALPEHRIWRLHNLAAWASTIVQRVPLLLPLVPGLSAVLWQFGRGRRRHALFATLLLLSAANALSHPYRSPFTRNRTCTMNRDAFVAIVEASQFLARVDPSNEANNVIYDLGEFTPRPGCGEIHLSKLFNSVRACRLTPKVYDWAKRSELSADDLRPWRKIAILSSRKNQEPFADEMIRAGERLGVPFGLAARTDIERGPFSFSISVLARVEAVAR